jgi:hypothetical protein
MIMTVSPVRGWLPGSGNAAEDWVMSHQYARR